LHVAHDVVREALTNVVRHADAAPTAVDVHRTRNTLVVTVANRGRPPREFVASRGLRGMQTRVEAAGGTLTAAPGRAGFTVTARLPLLRGTSGQNAAGDHYSGEVVAKQ
jgi:signal transduction histidine kinase